MLDAKERHSLFTSDDLEVSEEAKVPDLTEVEILYAEVTVYLYDTAEQEEAVVGDGMRRIAVKYKAMVDHCIAVASCLQVCK